MIILSHRGYWKNDFEKNTIKAFERSFSLGFGTETDIRDFNGDLVISHDMPKINSLTYAKDFFELYKNFNDNLPLALNIKSDGLQNSLKDMLTAYNINNYFVFDMSVPDGIQYIRMDFMTFTRQSEYEKHPSFYELSKGIWLDEFNEHWINKEVISDHVTKGKKICIVSPDLHKRSFNKEWYNYKNICKELQYFDIMLCTDYPEEAKIFYEN